jgi:hypothetical protein
LALPKVGSKSAAIKMMTVMTANNSRRVKADIRWTLLAGRLDFRLMVGMQACCLSFFL